MAREKQLQTEIIKWLRSNEVYVIKPGGPGTPVGCPDIIGLFRDRYIAIEVKASETAKNQPGQIRTLQHLAEHNKFIFRVSPENWPVVKGTLQKDFF